MPPAVQTAFERARRHWKSVRAGTVRTAMLAMSLRTTVRLAIIGVTAGSIGIIAVMTAAYLMLERVQRHIAFANAVSADAGKFNLLTAELFLQRSPRVLQQWSRQREILTRRLADMPPLKGQAAVLTMEMVRRLETVKHTCRQHRQVRSAGGRRDRFRVRHCTRRCHSFASDRIVRTPRVGGRPIRANRSSS